MEKVLNGIYIHSTVCITDVQYVFFESERLLSQFQSWLLIFIKGRPFIPCNLAPSNGRISSNALNPWDMLRINSKVHLEPRLAFQTKEPRELKFQGQTNIILITQRHWWTGCWTHPEYLEIRRKLNIYWNCIEFSGTNSFLSKSNCQHTCFLHSSWLHDEAMGILLLLATVTANHQVSI